MDSFKHRRPWTIPTRLGIKMAWPQNSRDAAIGWCLHGLAEKLEEREFVTADPIEAAIAEYRRMAAALGPLGEVDLYIYRNAKHFRGSRTDREGMTFAEHCEAIRKGAERMRDAGIPVRIKKARQ